jgi:hypothetical protein
MKYVIAVLLIIGGTWNMWFAFTLNRPGNFQAGGMCYVVCWFMLAMSSLNDPNWSPRRWGIRKCRHCDARRLSGRGMDEHMDEAHPIKWGGMSFYNTPLLESFTKPPRMPGLIEVPMTRMERFRTYLPWSWRSNHVTKLIREPNAPTTFKMRRYLTPESNA